VGHLEVFKKIVGCVPRVEQKPRSSQSDDQYVAGLAPMNWTLSQQCTANIVDSTPATAHRARPAGSMVAILPPTLVSGFI